jgi:uracil-DNA glycosylase
MNDAPDQMTSLRELAAAEASCTRCPLYREATQAVPGEGPRRATFMLVGEQPGDKEDLAGKPFVGPAGRVLDEALRDAGIAREQTFVTNAVKHFKHEMRGKRRLHKRPNNYEVERCRPLSLRSASPRRAPSPGAQSLSAKCVVSRCNWRTEWNWSSPFIHPRCCA